MSITYGLSNCLSQISPSLALKQLCGHQSLSIRPPDYFIINCLASLLQVVMTGRPYLNFPSRRLKYPLQICNQNTSGALCSAQQRSDRFIQPTNTSGKSSFNLPRKKSGVFQNFWKYFSLKKNIKAQKKVSFQAWTGERIIKSGAQINLLSSGTNLSCFCRGFQPGLGGCRQHLYFFISIKETNGRSFFHLLYLIVKVYIIYKLGNHPGGSSNNLFLYSF